jgi:DNA-binding transcriptional ArsR family regulator
MDALGDPTRRAVFERLRSGPKAVGELAAGLPVSRPAVSQHLRVLRRAGLVSERREGTRRLYRAEPPALAELRAYFDDFWVRALEAYRDEVERGVEG